ncbi:hypothetical protein GCM10010121_071710 [Streptomyces brasiliensis]|uniref:Transposase IS4-like domain-containing protein n=1 Tax=Streptomyces brasiliensis TaxID=1954 RepID=A0A917L9U1_9ACTN|nr:hypothetical protein GCM10010121_071710 [Streptomyces brasiliensis]
MADAGDKAAGKARPRPRAQANFTDPASRIMKNSDGAYIQAYNAQAVVDEEHQVITAADVTTNASDAANYTPMLDQSAHDTGTHPKQALVDAGYCSEANLEAARDRQLTCGTDTFMATGRLGHDEQVPPAPRGRIPKDATLKEIMPRKLWTKPGRAAYSRRKAIVEPVFGQIVICSCAARTGHAASGGCWPPATTSARSSDTPEPPASPPRSADTTGHTGPLQADSQDQAVPPRQAHTEQPRPIAPPRSPSRLPVTGTRSCHRRTARPGRRR